MLVRKDGDGRQGIPDPEVLKLFAAQEFGPPKKLSTRFWELFLFGKYCGQDPVFATDEENGFAASCGSFIYDGCAGAKALERMSRDFRGREFDLARTAGSFCLMRYRDGNLSLDLDRLGLYKVFRNAEGSVISSSFLAVLQTVKRPTADTQSIYEYVFQGATYDHRTIVEQISLLPPRTRFRLEREIQATETTDRLWQGPRWSSFSEHLQLTLAALRQTLGGLVSAFGSNIDTALSGGYDSRLLLALLRERGVTPRVHVYGRASDADVRHARAIAAGEGFAITHVDKAASPLPSPEQFAVIVARNHHLLDGYPADGVFEQGADAATRLERAAGGALALNGGGGEIFRNFFYLPDRSFSVRQLLWTFFAQFDPMTAAAAFDEARYFDNLANAVLRLLRLPRSVEPGDVWLTRQQIEYLYPCFRCTYWMGRNNSINNRFGNVGTPLVEPELVALALQIPIRYKNFGRFERALIRTIDPRLAGYPSDYGESFAAEPGLKIRAKGTAVLLRPPFLRRLSYRVKTRPVRSEFGGVFDRNYLSRALDVAFPSMRQYFRTDRVRGATEMNRICTLEYLFERYNVYCAK